MRVGVAVFISFVFAVAAVACKGDGKRKIERISPKSGTYRGGDPITVHGAGFSSGAGRQVEVFFIFPKKPGEAEPKREQATVQRIIGDNQIVLSTPPGNVGDEVDALFVFADGKELPYAKAYKYTDPAAGYGLDEMVTGKDKKKK